MLNNPIVNKLIATVTLIVLSVVLLWLLWNWVMPAIGVGQLSFLQFLGLWILIKGLTTELVKINWPTKSGQTGENNG